MTWASILLGFGVLIRVTMVVMMGMVCLIVAGRLLLRKWNDPAFSLLPHLKAAVGLALPVYACFLFLDRFYQWHRFGNWTHTYGTEMVRLYASLKPPMPPGYPFGFPFWAGFTGPLFTWRKSLFLYDPTVWLALLAPLYYGRRFTKFYAVMLGAIVLSLLLTIAAYATSYFWGGESAWGPRHSNVQVDLLCLVGLALAFQHYAGQPSRGFRALFYFLLGMGLLLQLCGLPVWDELEDAQGKYLSPWLSPSFSARSTLPPFLPATLKSGLSPACSARS